MNKKENYFKAVRFERPDYIPMVFAINDACWQAYPQEFLCEQIEKHPRLFEGYIIPTQTAHIGLINVHHRIRLIFGEPYGLRIESSAESGTRVFITLPILSS